MKIHNSIRSCLVVALVCAAFPLHAQSKRTMTPEELSRLTLGTPEQQRKAFPAHKIIGNIYYVGTEIQAAFLVTTPAATARSHTGW